MYNERQRKLHEYQAMGSSYGKPSPLVLLPLAELLLSKSDNSLLWWVGVLCGNWGS